MITLFAILSILTWSEPEVGDSLKLTQDIDLVSVQFPVGKMLRLVEIEPLGIPGAPVVLYTLVEEQCENPEAKSDMEIITPNGSPESSAVGVELSPGCTWDIYVEQKDLFTESFFARAD